MGGLIILISGSISLMNILA